MKTGIVFLVLAYVLSQFYRAFLAVLTRVLETDIGATSADLAASSGYWFIAFAAMQIPVGWALDAIGPRKTASVLMAIGAAGGAYVFSIATEVWHIHAAMILIGIGCAPILMAAFFTFAKTYPPAIFATLSGITIGIGSLGNLASSTPLAWAVAEFGWRGSLVGLATITLISAITLAIFVKDPPRATTTQKGSFLTLLRIPALWFILPLVLVAYAPAAGIRGLWIGPYLQDVYAASDISIGNAGLIMGVAMIAASFAYGAADRIFGTRKWVILTGTALSAALCFALFLYPTPSYTTAIAMLAAIGFLGSAFPLVVAHGRSFVPDHLTGRGVTLLNLFGIGGVGTFQFITGRVFDAHPATQTAPAYGAIFLVFAVSLTIGCAIYAFSQDSLD